MHSYCRARVALFSKEIKQIESMVSTLKGFIQCSYYSLFWTPQSAMTLTGSGIAELKSIDTAAMKRPSFLIDF